MDPMLPRVCLRLVVQRIGEDGAFSSQKLSASDEQIIAVSLHQQKALLRSPKSQGLLDRKQALSVRPGARPGEVVTLSSS